MEYIMNYLTFDDIKPATFEKIFPSIDIQYPSHFGTDSLYDDLLNNFLKQFEITDSQPLNSSPQLTNQNVNTAAPSDLMAAIQKHLGETYSQARRKSNGYSDCSSFVSKVYKELGIDLGFTPSPGLWKKYVNHIDLSQVKPGDLVFLTYSKKHGSKKMGGIYREAGVTPSHVGIVVSVNGTELEIAENTGNSKSRINKYEVGDPTRRERGVINYAKGSGRANEILGFGRLKSLA